MSHTIFRSRQHGSARTRALLLAAFAMAAMGTASTQARAANASAEVQPVEVDIPAGPLGSVLGQFAGAAGVVLSFDSTLTENRTSEGLRGRYTVTEGFSRLLSGHRLLAVRSDDGIYLLQKLPTSTDSPAVLPPVKVRAEVDAAPTDLPDVYAGGQVANGGRLGLLGAVDVMETPFSVVNFTEEFTRDLQAKDVREVLRFDSSVQDINSFGLSPVFSIRGFQLGKGELGVNGLYGMGNADGYLEVQPYERIEMMKGPSALLQGALEGGIGGSVSMVTKRAADEPLTRVSALYETEDVLGTTVDFGRRFGADGQWGVRTNLLYRKGTFGDTRFEQEMKLASVALDYRGERFRASLDYVGQRQHTQGDGTDSCDGWDLDANPDRDTCPNPTNWWNAEQNFDLFIAALEYDLSEHWSVSFKYGQNEAEDFWPATYPDWSSEDPDGTVALMNQMWAMVLQPKSSELNLYGEFATGPVRHELVVGASLYERKGWSLWMEEATGVRVPIATTPPDITLPTPDRSDLPYDGKNSFRSYAVVDRLSLADERYQLLLGLRHQNVEQEGYYDESAVTPSVGLVYRPSSQWMVYGSYIEDLEQGPQAPENEPSALPPRYYVNAGAFFPPTESEQYEIGAKWENGSLGATAALFQISQMNGIAEPTDTPNTFHYSIDGERRHRGLELSVFGEPFAGVRLLGSYTYMDAEFVKTEGGAADGEKVMGIPDHRFVLNAEYDLPAVQGLTFTGAITASTDASRCSVYLGDPTLCGTLPGYTTLDAGARYRFALGGKATTLRLNVTNLTDKKYFATAAPAEGWLTYGQERRLSFSAEVDF
ncbi:MAG TPA: TonB-dependent receptor [Povalibacter sp.]|uniref:TonB-dependent receptor n=1 Tax=Povalibacter sp. TaxID=1962978 RepID=UPI002C9D5E6A|nr:TonB-dependent receptor [Povalibacter sp.]HMN43764.1 TonB-dependent receptor [Povalibacter sp.]